MSDVAMPVRTLPPRDEIRRQLAESTVTPWYVDLPHIWPISYSWSQWTAKDAAYYYVNRPRCIVALGDNNPSEGTNQ